MTVAKAAKATLELGSLQLDCYQKPDGNYAFSMNQMKETLGIFIGDSTGKKYAKPLMEANSHQVNMLAIEGSNAKAKLIDLKLFSEIVAAYAQLGNKECMAVCFASVTEALERRADKAFDVVRTEKERNARFEQRRAGIMARKGFTNTIQLYISEHPELSTNYVRFIYSNVSDCINRQLFGMKAKGLWKLIDAKKVSLMDECDIKNSEALRDYFPADVLKEIESIESAATSLVFNRGYEPFAAVKETLDFLCLPTYELYEIEEMIEV